MRTLKPTARTFELVAAIADRLALDFDDTVAEMDATAIEAVPAFGADAAIAAELTANHRSLLERFLTFAQHAESPLPIGVPPEALNGARTVARRGIDLDAIPRALGVPSRWCANAGWPVRMRSSVTGPI
ncbi:hypothetical protein OHA27_33335 [Streptomyces sp. NBC_01619]|uniref:hypothetical protein n=1 Tax=Streptomyces sp. NBC_01619 TaxID=2975901 RepID=UPI0022573D53|nr:hypothetical protein [Streptomyces sp. NBC_01619]MCX4515121.1 hypothetical protein [Streptomyces sp. NBC_01619]